MELFVPHRGVLDSSSRIKAKEEGLKHPASGREGPPQRRDPAGWGIAKNSQPGWTPNERVTMSESSSLTLRLRILVSLLGVQFLLGIWVNLFGTFPSTDSVGTALMYGGDPVLSAHYVVALVVFLLALTLLARTIRVRQPSHLRWLILAGFLSVVWASVSGVEFILSGFSNAGASFSMASAFIVAVSFYGVAQVAVMGMEQSSPPAGGQPAARAPSGARGANEG